MRKILLVMVVAAQFSYAQSISPVIAQYKQKARGGFTIMNPTLKPLAAVITPMSFSVDAEGKNKFRPLDAGIHVRLSQTSFSVSPKGEHSVDYDVTCDAPPCWLQFLVTMSGFNPTPSGVKVTVTLPTVAYVTGKRGLRREDVSILETEGVIEVSNHGLDYGRMQNLEVRYSDGTTQSFGSAPLFPAYTRRFRPTKPVVKATARFEKFRLELR